VLFRSKDDPDDPLARPTDPADLKSYRPISNLSTLSKLLERPTAGAPFTGKRRSSGAIPNRVI